MSWLLENVLFLATIFGTLASFMGALIGLWSARKARQAATEAFLEARKERRKRFDAD